MPDSPAVSVPVAIYARSSVVSEDSDDAQVERLKRACRERDLGESQVFVDDGVSGIRDNRPELGRLRGAMHRGELTATLVTKVDRLGRSLGMSLPFWDEAESSGVRVIVTEQGIDTSTPSGKLQRNMLAAVSEFERETILERTKAGIDRARAAGKRFGRPPRLTAEQRAECLRRLTNGESSRAVARALKIPASTVR